ncbi:ribonuclease H-like domain-containing protein [Tanacetum coccineum]
MKLPPTSDNDVADSVTLISKLDISNPLHLHPNDTTALTVVSIKLKGTKNYQVWSCAMLLALEGKNKIGFIDDDSCMQIRSSILSREVLPDVRSAYATISSEESHRVAVGSIAGSSQRNQAFAFVSNVPNSQNFQRSNQNFSTRPSRPNNMNNNRQDEQIATLISLIKDNKARKNVQANMAGENQHMTYTDKELDNVLDISHLRIKVVHPNETEAYISKIRNLRLSNGLTLYDVMVIPKCCVILISVHKLAKENKVIVAFDENRCYFLNQDLSLKNVLGIDDQCEGLYYYNNQGIDYEETFSPVVKMVTVRCLLNVVVCMSWPVFQLDVNNVFLYGNLAEVVYMKPPEGYFSSDNKVCRLKKSLYGLKQAPRQWNAKLTSTLIENGFSQSKSHYSLYIKFDKRVFLTLLVYVDDIIITGNSISEIEKFKEFLKSKFMIKDLGKLKYFFGIEVVDTDKGICFNQRKYVLDLLSEYGMLTCKPVKTPLMSKLVISNKASENDPILENVTDYQKLMGKLIYLTNTRPDISYDVHCLSQFMHSSLSSHLKIAFKILRYLKSCPGLGIHIVRTFGMFLNAYSDADWANNSAIKIAANLVFHERTKHLEIDLHFVRDKILNGVVKTVKVDSANQIVDILTKGLDTI